LFVASLSTPAFSDTLVYEEHQNQRASEIGLLTYCICSVLRIYLLTDTPDFCTSSRFSVDPVYLSESITISKNKEAFTTKEANIMALYLVQAAYTAEALATMAKNPQDRTIPISELMQKLGGRSLGIYYCFGEYDIIAIAELPDDSAASAFALAAISPGHLKAYKTTKLFTVEETMEAMRKAGSLAFQGPSKG
jgi:uncharacterized protein with GYD domain